jgi:hypothetical protein
MLVGPDSVPLDWISSRRASLGAVEHANTFKGVPFGEVNDHRMKLISQMQPDDQIHKFKNSSSGKGRMQGCVVIRDVKVMGCIVTMIG